MLQDDCQSPSTHIDHPLPTEAADRRLCQKFTMCPANGMAGGDIVEYSTLRLLRWSMMWGLLVVLGLGSSARAEEADKKTAATTVAAKASHNRKPYPPLRTASGQPAASSSAPLARATVPPLRDAVAGTTPPMIFDGKGYLMVGKGELTGSETPRYQIALYLEHVGARAQFGSLLTRAPTRAMLMSESRAQYFVIWGRFAKLLVLKMTKPASKTELADMFRSGMAEVFGDRTPVELRKDAESLLKLVDHDLAEGQELRIHISEQAQIDLYLDGVKHAGPQNSKLARHLIEIWLGYRSVAHSLRNVLIDKIEVLKTPLTKASK